MSPRELRKEVMQAGSQSVHVGAGAGADLHHAWQPARVPASTGTAEGHHTPIWATRLRVVLRGRNRLLVKKVNLHARTMLQHLRGLLGGSAGNECLE
jgi:hypothetical protein